MEEARATYCFCGCGTRVKHPRLVVTNTNGWELSGELAEWTKLQLVWQRLSLNLSDELKRNIADGHHHWKQLVAAIHTGERADKDQEAHAVAWRKHAKKARRKLRKRLRREGFPDPFDYPDMESIELTAWITGGVEPPWTADLDEAIDDEPGEAESATSEDSLAFQLVSAALQHVRDASWEWDPVAEKAIIVAADRLSEFREDFDLVLDAAALGFWIRAAEHEVVGTVNVFDPGYIDQIKADFDDDPAEAITVAMTDVAKGLPAPFAQGPEVWSEVLELSVAVLEERGRQLLSQDDEFDEDVELGHELREFALGLGYGLATTVDALGIEGTRARQ